jgi:hypothetical protein
VVRASQVLVFNVLLAAKVLKEKMSNVQYAGCAIVAVSVAVCGAFSPEVLLVYDVETVATMASHPISIVYMAYLLIKGCCLIYTIRWFDEQYPGYWKNKEASLDKVKEDPRHSVLTSGLDAEKKRQQIADSRQANQKKRGRGRSSSSANAGPRGKPSSSLITKMLFVHTNTLAVFESMVQLCLKVSRWYEG